MMRVMNVWLDTRTLQDSFLCPPGDLMSGSSFSLLQMLRWGCGQPRRASLGPLATQDKVTCSLSITFSLLTLSNLGFLLIISLMLFLYFAEAMYICLFHGVCLVCLCPTCFQSPILGSLRTLPPGGVSVCYKETVVRLFLSYNFLP